MTRPHERPLHAVPDALATETPADPVEHAALVVAARYDLSADEAADLLRQWAATLGVKVRTVADIVVLIDAQDLPGDASEPDLAAQVAQSVSKLRTELLMLDILDEPGEPPADRS
jgi:ANTAR domain-containing protein